MTTAQASEAIYEQFATAFAALRPTVPVSFDNEEFDPPASGPWVRLSVGFQASQQDTLGAPGSRKYRRLGSVYVQVFVERDAGRKDSDLIAQDVVSSLEGFSLGGGLLVLYASSPRDVGNDGRWYMKNVATPFDFEETR